MFPTRANYPGRWNNINCKICNQIDNDEHLFHCPGYSDIIPPDIEYKMFFTLDNDTKQLKKGAKCLKRIKERLETIQDDE